MNKRLVTDMKPNGGVPPRGSLLSVFCDECHVWVTSVASEGGPVLVRHRFRRPNPGGRPLTCKRIWVVSNHAGTITKELVPEGDSPKEALRIAAKEWAAG